MTIWSKGGFESNTHHFQWKKDKRELVRRKKGDELTKEIYWREGRGQDILKKNVGVRVS